VKTRGLTEDRINLVARHAVVDDKVETDLGQCEMQFLSSAVDRASAACQVGARIDDRNVVTIPRLPSVTGANRSPGWNRWSAAEKVEHLLGLSLDRMREYLSWPADGLDP
jgi:hypothetical protein